MFKFGIITDVQYADIPNGASFTGIPRYYRAAIPNLRRAVMAWKRADVDFCIHLGDIIDGFNPKAESETALTTVLAEFEQLGKPHYHMLGNHCLYNFPRQVLNKRLKINEQGNISYYSFSPHPAWRFIVLDSYDVSMLGWPAGHPLHEEAKQILEERNPHKDKNNPTRPEGVPQEERRFVMFNGGLSSEQMLWLRSELQAARKKGQKAIVFSHLPLHPETCSKTCLLWNYAEVLDLLHAHKDVCVATLAGHTHTDGQHCDEDGIYHRVLAGVVESPEDIDCWGTVEVSQLKVDIVGAGNLQSGTMLLKPAELH